MVPFLLAQFFFLQKARKLMVRKQPGHNCFLLTQKLTIHGMFNDTQVI